MNSSRHRNLINEGGIPPTAVIDLDCCVTKVDINAFGSAHLNKILFKA